MKLDKNILLKSFLVGFLYVGLGTLSVLGMYPDSPVYSEWSMLGVLITMPVSVLGFGIAYMESDNYELIFLVQTGIFLVFWLIVYQVWVKRSKKKL